MRRLEVAVVGAAAQAVEEAAGERLELRAQVERSSRSPSVRAPPATDRPRWRRAPRAAGGPARRWPARPRSRTGGRPWPRARRPARVHDRHRDHLQGGGEALLAVGGDHDRRGLVGPVDRDLLGHVVGGRAGEAGGAHEDERLGRQVDVLLVLGGVAGDRLVAELGQLDPHLGGGDAVRPVADDGPVALRRRQLLRGGGDLRPAREHLSIASGRSRSAASSRWVDGVAADDVGDGDGQQEAGGDLGVERLGRRDAHLDVAPSDV